MFTIFVIVAVFVAVAALIGGVALYFRRDREAEVEDRLDILTGAKEAVAAGAKGESSLLAVPLDDRMSAIEEMVSRFLNLRLFLDQADVNLSPTKFFLICGGAAGAGVLVPLVFGLHFGFSPLAGLVLGVLPFFFVWFKRKRRLGKFAKQLPEALELIARALRAGHSLASGLSLVAEEMNEPIRREFAKAYEAQNLGIPLEEALEEMTERVPNLDLRFFATSVILQRQTGGDLAEILDKIGTLVRERFKIWGQIQSLTGEGRLSGIVLLALPPVLFVVMYRLNPDYVLVLFNDPLGHQMLAVAVVMQIIGALVIKKIVNIKV